MGNHLNLNYHLDRPFTDVDDLTEQARQWDLDFRPLERGRFRGRLFQFGSHGVHIADARFRLALRQMGSPPAGMKTVAIPATPELSLEWREHSIDGNSLMIFPDGGELSSVSGADFHVYTCSFPEHLLSTDEPFAAESFSKITNDIEAIQVAPSTINQIRSLLAELCDAARNNRNVSREQFAWNLTKELPARLLLAVAEANGRCDKVAGARRLLAVSKAESFIKRNKMERITISSICREAGVSERTLRNAFQERFGIGPKEYIQAHRFISVRRDLRAADPRSSRVIDIANQWGFWHMGQFASEYRRRFHELPSQTLDDNVGLVS